MRCSLGSCCRGPRSSRLGLSTRILGIWTLWLKGCLVNLRTIGPPQSGKSRRFLIKKAFRFEVGCPTHSRFSNEWVPRVTASCTSHHRRKHLIPVLSGYDGRFGALVWWARSALH